MNRRFFPKLAVINIKKNAKTYIPYMLTCIGTIMMFYNMYNMSLDKGFENMIGGADLKMIMGFGTYVIGIFACIFLFYTNSFLIKRRKREFGLFNILGMEKKHISKAMAYETYYVGIISLAAGISSGILLSKLLHLLLLKLLKFPVELGFHIDFKAVAGTVILFCFIFLATYVNTLRQIHLAKPVELLSGGQVGEKEPKVKWLLVAAGIICLFIGYYIAITTESPLEAMLLFFIAVILVIAGTYFLFTTGSIALLKLLRKNKKYYYKTRHFTSVSGMLYRMKQNAVGLSNICILSTMVLVMVSGTIALYFGSEDALRTRFPRNVMVKGFEVPKGGSETLTKSIEAILKKNKLEPEDIVYYSSQVFNLNREGNEYTNYYKEVNMNASGTTVFTCIPLSDYNRTAKESKTLKNGQCLLYEANGSIPGKSVKLGNTEFTIKERLGALDGITDPTDQLIKNFYLVLPNENTISELYLDLTGEENPGMGYYYGFDTNADAKSMLSVSDKLGDMIKKNGFSGYSECVEQMRNDFNILYGGMLFLGIFLGLLFIMAMVLIIYYKQISEGYDDKERFRIMQNVGMSHAEVKKSIRSQVLTVFFLPLVTAGIHVAFAFKMITKLLSLLNLTNVPLFAWCVAGTLLIFTLFYGIVYVLTAKVYYRIVAK